MDQSSPEPYVHNRLDYRTFHWAPETIVLDFAPTKLLRNLKIVFGVRYFWENIRIPKFGECEQDATRNIREIRLAIVRKY